MKAAHLELQSPLALFDFFVPLPHSPELD